MTKTEKWIAGGLIALWALLYLPGLRTSPNWYGDEGEWMEKSWTFIHGTPRVGPVTDDFVFPYPYPPLYMVVNGVLLRVFGNDIVVGRALGAVTALAAAGILFWMGCRLRDRTFGVLCAAAFLVYAESVMNFRWVRSHPMAGTLALASCGFLVRYVQEKRLRDALLAGAMCSLATATNYFAYPLIGAVGVTALVANRRQWWHAVAACAVAGSYGVLFVAWYSATRGWGHLMSQVQLLTSVAGNEMAPTAWGEVMRFAKNVWTLGFKTPTQMGPRGWQGRDWWLWIATSGMLWLPVTRNKWLRLALPVWALVLMYGVFKKLNNVPLFFYPATMFLPLLAIGFAGVMTWAGEAVKRLGAPGGRALPGILACAYFGWASLNGALDRFESKIDMWSQQSPAEAEAAMAFVNANTTSDDFVMVPKQIYWLVKNAKKSMLTFSPRYEGIVNDMPTAVLERHDAYWFDCRWQNAKYLVLASGVTASGQPRGIDLIYARGLKGVQEVMDGMIQEKWPVVFSGGHQVALADVGQGKRWPVVVGGEYLVMANPQFMKGAN